MIKKLEHRKIGVSEQIREVFQASYVVEAELLGASDFPPLKRPLHAFTQCRNDFYGYFHKGSLAGVVEVVPGPDPTHIQSLVVLPAYFRLGIGSALANFVLEVYQSQIYTVETGLENKPATTLYLKLGFRETGQYDTDHGIRKIKFEKRRDPLA